MPTAGLSGSTVLADELRATGMCTSLISAVVVWVAVPLAIIPRERRVPVVVAGSVFTNSALSWAATVIALAGRERLFPVAIPWVRQSAGLKPISHKMSELSAARCLSSLGKEVRSSATE